MLVLEPNAILLPELPRPPPEKVAVYNKLIVNTAMLDCG